MSADDKTKCIFGVIQVAKAKMRLHDERLFGLSKLKNQTL